MKKDDQQNSLSGICPGRREFLKKSLKYGCAGAMGLALPSLITGCDPSILEPVETPPQTQTPIDDIRPDNQTLVSSAWIPKGEHENSYALFKRMVEAATDFSWLSRGDRVLIKVALNSANVYPATTDPWAVGCMVDILQEKGAGTIIVGDKSGIFQSAATLRAFNRTGIEAAIDGRATLGDFDQGGFKSVRADGWAGNINIPRLVDEVDHIIYIPRIATHMMAGQTLSLKIAVGFLNAASRRTMHSGDIHRYASVNDVPDIKGKFRLTVTSACKLMTTGGPDNGTIVEPNHGLIFASENILASDLLASAFLNVNRRNQSNIYNHPSITSYISRNGDIDDLYWEQLNTNPDSSVTNNIRGQLRNVTT